MLKEVIAYLPKAHGDLPLLVRGANQQEGNRLAKDFYLMLLGKGIRAERPQCNNIRIMLEGEPIIVHFRSINLPVERTVGINYQEVWTDHFAYDNRG